MALERGGYIIVGLVRWMVEVVFGGGEERWRRGWVVLSGCCVWGGGTYGVGEISRAYISSFDSFILSFIFLFSYYGIFF